MADQTRVHQVVSEVVNSGTPQTKVHQLVSEVVNSGSPVTRMHQLVSEVVNSGTPQAKVHQLVVEVVNKYWKPPQANYQTSKFRLLFTNTQQGVSHTAVSCAEIELHATRGGIDETDPINGIGGTASAYAVNSSYPADNAVDDVSNTIWISTFTAGLTWWEFEFNQETIILEYTITARHDTYVRDTPTEWWVQVEYAGQWVDVLYQTTPADWVSSETRTFYLSLPANYIPPNPPAVSDARPVVSILT